MEMENMEAQTLLLNGEYGSPSQRMKKYGLGAAAILGMVATASFTMKSASPIAMLASVPTSGMPTVHAYVDAL
jgi:hypothetical protein